MIITDEKTLRLPCLDAIEDEVPHLIQALEKELAYSAIMGRKGIGLACPQINLQKKVAIVRIENGLNVNLVNAKITQGYDLKIFKNEGCLSFPDMTESTERFQEIVVSNNLIPPHNFIATGLFAVCIQHELDHLNNILLPDRAIKKVEKIKIGPNDPCICGSKKKFKKCCQNRKG